METKPTIALFMPSLNGGGAERAMIVFSEGLLELGYEVDLLVAHGEGPLHKIVPSGVRVIDFQKKKTVNSLFILTKYLRKTRPAALYSTIPHANLVAILAAWFAGNSVPVIVRESNSPITEKKRSLMRNIVHLLTPWLYPRAKAVIAVSTGVAQQLRAMEQPLAGVMQLHVLPTPVISRHCIEQSKQTVIHPWLVTKTTPIILACGRLVPAKGFDVLLKAFKKTGEAFGARLIIIGEGSSRSELEHQARQLGIDHLVSMPGFQINPFPYFTHSDLFVLSSRFEGMPNVLLQALAFGLPVVATDCKSGPRECLDDGALGALVPVDSVEKLAEAMVAALTKRMNRQVPIHNLTKYSAVEASREYLKLADLAERSEPASTHQATTLAA